MYKGLKPVLWCTQDQTALAEAEVEYMDHESPSVYVKFPFDAASRNGLALPVLRESRRSPSLFGPRRPGRFRRTRPSRCILKSTMRSYASATKSGHAEKLVEEVTKACELTATEILAARKAMTDSRPFAVIDRWVMGFRRFCLATS